MCLATAPADRRTDGDRPGEEAVTIEDHGLDVTYAGISVLLGRALILMWLRLWGRGLRPLLWQTALSVSGYLRPCPDEATEAALRIAFMRLDKELAEAIGDRPVPHPYP